MYRNVLLLSAGRRVSLLRGFQQAANKIGSKVFAADHQPELSAAAQVSGKYIQLPHVLSNDYAEKLLAVCLKHSIGLVIPTIDTELQRLSTLKQKFEQHGTHILVCSSQFINICRDKRITARFFEEHNLCTPERYALDDIKYPSLVKPFDGSLSNGIHILKSATDLTVEMTENPKNIFLEYIDQDTHDEFTCDMFYNQTGHLVCVVPRRRIQVRGGEVSKAIAERDVIVDLLRSKLAQLPGVSGPITLQLFKNKKTAHCVCIEINARFGGGYPLTRLAGADYQNWLLDEYILQRPRTEWFDDWEEGLMMLRYDAEVCVRAK